jgi:hypothetical protein
MQNDDDRHDTEVSVLVPSMSAGAPQALPLKATALPPLTATQNEGDGHDSELTEPTWRLTGADHPVAARAAAGPRHASRPKVAAVKTIRRASHSIRRPPQVSTALPLKTSPRANATNSPKPREFERGGEPIDGSRGRQDTRDASVFPSPDRRLRALTGANAAAMRSGLIPPYSRPISKQIVLSLSTA